MNKPTKQLLFWAPRVLCMLFIAFLAMFALDVFGEGYDLADTVTALAMHLIPAGIVLVVLLISWRWEWVGAVMFVALGVLYLASFWGRFHWSAYLGITGPLFLVGALFLVDWVYRKELRVR